MKFFKRCWLGWDNMGYGLVFCRGGTSFLWQEITPHIEGKREPAWHRWLVPNSHEFVEQCDFQQKKAILLM